MTELSVEVDWDDICFETNSGEIIDSIVLNRSGFSVELGSLGGLYALTSHTPKKAKFFVLDNKEDAIQLFKTELSYCIYEWGCEDTYEKKEGEKILKKYGFYEDVKMIYKIFDEMLPNSIMASVSCIREHLKNEKKLDPRLITAGLSFLTEKGYLSSEYKDYQTFYCVSRVTFARSLEQILEEIDQPSNQLDVPKPPPVLDIFDIEIEKVKNKLELKPEVIKRTKELVEQYQPFIDEYIEREIKSLKEKYKMGYLSTGGLSVDLRKDMLPEIIIGACLYIACNNVSFFQVAQAQGHYDEYGLRKAFHHILYSLNLEKK